MGELVDLSACRRRRQARTVARVVDHAHAHAYVDLADPFSYLAVERLERTFETVAWRPACQAALQRRDAAADAATAERLRADAEHRAARLRLPLQWPDRFPAPVPAAMRAASYAVEQGRGGAFILAAGRLAFCGGFDLDDPEILAEAAAAAGIGLDATLEAARDAHRDAAIEEAGKRLLAAGALELPALRAGRALVSGEARISAFLTAGGAATALVP